LTEIERMPRGAARKQAAFDRLVATAAESQKPFVELAEKLKASGAIAGYRSLVSPNMLVVDPTSSGRLKEIREAFQVDGVKAIYDQEAHRVWAAPGTAGVTDATAGVHQHRTGEPSWGLDVTSPLAVTPAPSGIVWNLDMVGAPEAWKQGATGKGVTVGSIDTGTDVSHPAIHDNYRGLNADGTLTNDYNWYDPSNVASPFPTDEQGHGTHTVGTMVGHTSEANIGVAPEAKWVSAKALGFTSHVSENMLTSMQWMLAPTKSDGSAPDPSKAPDVVGMSWWTGSPYEDFFQESVQNLVSAGIEPVKSNGNNGPAPETVSSPGQFAEVTSVAAVDKNGQIAYFSSRGPSPLPHTGKTPVFKPDVSAPGVDVVSSTPGGKYGRMSGTSMAQPHVTGVIADILSKYPTLSHQQLQSVLAKSSTDVGATGRDLEFGYGIVNVSKALEVARAMVQRSEAAKRGWVTRRAHRAQ
jgi:subtilisin family serine protease